MPTVLSIEDTLYEILENNCSICRYGDGEILFFLYKLSQPSQKYEHELHDRLVQILKSNHKDILVGLPIGYHSMENLTEKSRLKWTSHIVWTYPRLKKYLDLSKTYYNASMTRPYVNYIDKSNCKGYFEKLMKIWEGREVLLVEGEKSRLGVGNNLFRHAKNVQRILAPSVNAFSNYKQLLQEVYKHDKSKLILIALGPTATVMAYDLAISGYQAIDIGNIDIEYEWYLRGTDVKIKIPGKYSNEVAGGCEVEDIVNEEYKNQIIMKVT